MKATKTNLVKFYKFQLRTNYFNNGFKTNSMLLDRRHNNLRVISTPEFPVPYYQRIFREAPVCEDPTLNILKLNQSCDQNVVIRTKEELAQTSEGLKAIEFVENKMAVKSINTRVQSVGVQADIYAEDLMNYIDASHDENCRILSSCDLSDCLK